MFDEFMNKLIKYIIVKFLLNHKIYLDRRHGQISVQWNASSGERREQIAESASATRATGPPRRVRSRRAHSDREPIHKRVYHPSRQRRIVCSDPLIYTLQYCTVEIKYFGPNSTLNSSCLSLRCFLKHNKNLCAERSLL